MEERQKNTPTPDSTAAFERQRKRKVILVAAVGSCLVIAFIWLLFKPAPTIGEGQTGINTTLPDGKAPKIEVTSARPRSAWPARSSPATG